MPREHVRCSVKHRLTFVLGEENAAHILALMAQVGEEGEQIVMLLIAEVVGGMNRFRA